jgi:anti-sigma B factor antagonist
MNIHVTSVKDVALLELDGRFDSSQSAYMTESLDQVLQDGTSRILVDFDKVPFLDSTALASLVQGMKRCRQQNGDLYLCAMQENVKVIFSLTRLDKAFQIFASQAEALQKIDE